MKILNAVSEIPNLQRNGRKLPVVGRIHPQSQLQLYGDRDFQDSDIPKVEAAAALCLSCYVNYVDEIFGPAWNLMNDDRSFNFRSFGNWAKLLAVCNRTTGKHNWGIANMPGWSRNLWASYIINSRDDNWGMIKEQLGIFFAAMYDFSNGTYAKSSLFNELRIFMPECYYTDLVNQWISTSRTDAFEGLVRINYDYAAYWDMDCIPMFRAQINPPPEMKPIDYQKIQMVPPDICSVYHKFDKWMIWEARKSWDDPDYGPAEPVELYQQRLLASPLFQTCGITVPRPRSLA